MPLGPQTAARSASQSTPAPSWLGIAACWLRAHALRPGLDELGCDADDICALNEAFAETMPALHAEKLLEPDARMAAKLKGLCDELAVEGGHSEGAAAVPRRVVVAIVGAQHVPGLARRLLESSS